MVCTIKKSLVAEIIMIMRVMYIMFLPAVGIYTCARARAHTHTHTHTHSVQVTKSVQYSTVHNE